MAVVYFVQTEGVYVAYGLSSDTKPATPPAGALFIETDTGIKFKVVASAWVSTSPATDLNLGSAAEYVILSGSTLTNGVHDQLVTGNTGHVGTLTDTFTYVSGIDVAGSAKLGSSSTPLLPLGDAYSLNQALYNSIPTFSYAAGAVDLATDINSPDGIGIFKTGTYKITGACNIGAAGITLTGLGNFVFIITGAFDTTAAAAITLLNGASASNVYFVCGGIVTFGAATIFKGTVLAGNNAITTGANLNLNGRLISQVAVTIGGGVNTITAPLSISSALAWGDITGTLADQTDLLTALNLLQLILVSGTNIKTINGSNVLGAGDLVVAAALPESVYTSNIITADTTIPANSSLVVRGRLKVNSGIRLKPASGASIITI